MGFMDSVKQQFEKNKDKATEQFEKNKHKVAPLVNKATDQVDKATKGKSSSITAKVDQAARKISASPSTGSNTSTTTPMPTWAPPAEPAQGTSDPAGPADQPPAG